MIKRSIEWCAEHPRWVIACVLSISLIGFASLGRISVDAMPDLSDTQVVVFTEWSGRNPAVIEEQVTYPLVTSLLATSGVTDVRGMTMFGMSFVYVVFADGTPSELARTRVSQSLDLARRSLPEGVFPSLGPDALGVGWGLQYALVDRSGEHDAGELRALQDFQLRYALLVPGVAEIATIGGSAKQYQVQLSASALAARGISFSEVVSLLRANNRDVGGRTIESNGREIFVRGRGYLKNVADLEQLVLRSDGNGATLFLRDVAQVSIVAEPRRGVADLSGEGEVTGGIVVVRQNTNTYEVLGRVKERLQQVQKSLPKGVEIVVTYDRTSLIEQVLSTLAKSLSQEILLVVAMILAFLLHWQSAVIPALSLPIALLVAAVPMALFKIPATIMSIGGIGIAIGAMVDAEIVMIEACHNALERDPKATRQTLNDAAASVTPAIFYSLLIVAVAFLPVFALSGPSARLFTPMALTKTFAMLAAALLSITFAPALRGLLLRGRIRREAEHPISRAMVRVYKPFVHLALTNPKTTIAIGAMAVLSAIGPAMRLGSEFMPTLDEGDLLYMPVTLPNISAEEARRVLQRQDHILAGFGEVASVHGKAGRADSATDPAPLSMVETVIRLKPESEWPPVFHSRWYSTWAPDLLSAVLRPLWPDQQRRTRGELKAALAEAVAMPGFSQAFTMPIKARIDMQATGIRTALGLKILGDRLDTINELGTRLERELRQVPGARGVFFERSSDGYYLDVTAKPEAQAVFGLSVGELNDLIELAIGGATVTTLFNGRERYSASVRFFSSDRDLQSIRRLPVLIPPSTRSVSRSRAGADSAKMSAGNAMSTLNLSRPDAGAAAGSAMDRGGGAASVAVSRTVALEDLATLELVSGPPVIRDDGGRLAGYLYVDVDESATDMGTYVARAKAQVEGLRAELVPPGFELVWTGQYEAYDQTKSRLLVIIPLTLSIIAGLLYLVFRKWVEVAIVMLSLPFAWVGSVWLCYALGYHLSVAVWVGMLALAGLAAQTGVVMIIYIDQAFLRRRAAGQIHTLEDIIEAHSEGTVQRLRPKVMTVATMFFGLLPLLWANGAGADVMKRVAAPMVGGLLSSLFLTLEIIPVVYTYWRYHQLQRGTLEKDA